MMLPEHLCHAKNCKVQVPPSMFMCRDHWYMLPKVMRDILWALYSPGQEITKTPSQDYLEHAQECIDYVAEKESVNG